MGSNAIKLSKVLREFRRIQGVFKENLTNEYDVGVYNGLELAWSLMNQKEPKYVLRTDVNEEVMPRCPICETTELLCGYNGYEGSCKSNAAKQ